ncbi:unnamed protein product [Phaedon cochleariae]|uniref:Uncharacterized protein n=1 Tax=Phaedon cochleariae TaxID=80249 RepID=A0A9N9X092_PHACE|nr:unnamed protein product [Phaedon cochleariae]
MQERRRLKERYPSLALVYKDQEQIAMMLNNYEELLQSRTICEGRCALGERCPTGVCRQSQKRVRRRSSRSQSEMHRSPSTSSNASTTSNGNARPRSGPAGYRNFPVRMLEMASRVILASSASGVVLRQFDKLSIKFSNCLRQ